jgi:hypothetical protein
MNLRLYKGRVPLQSGDADHPIVLVDFPTREQFDALQGKGVKAESRDRYWEMLQARAGGLSFADVARQYGITRERARQIEAKFLRQMQTLHLKTKPSSVKT